MFVGDAMEEGVVDIKLVYGPIALGGEGEHGAHRHWLHDRAVSFAVINARALREPPNDPSGLVSFEAAVFLEFVAEDPFATDDVGARWPRNELPCIVGDQGIKLGLHS